jgi:hypothetical protein
VGYARTADFVRILLRSKKDDALGHFIDALKADRQGHLAKYIESHREESGKDESLLALRAAAKNQESAPSVTENQHGIKANAPQTTETVKVSSNNV